MAKQLMNSETNNAAVWGMALGISSLFRLYLGVPFGVAGLIASIIGLKKARETGVGRGYALTGLICSIIGLLFAIAYLVFLIMILMLGFSSQGLESSGLY